MTNLITVANVKDFGKIDHDEDDSIIEDILIPGAQQWMESHLDCKLEETSVTEDIVDGFGESLWPTYKPVTAMTTATGVYDIWTEEYVDYVRYTDRRIYRTKEVDFPDGAKRYQLAYTAGYTSTTVPASIKIGLLMLVVRALNNPAQKGRQSANGFGFSWEELAKTDIPALVADESFKEYLT